MAGPELVIQQRLLLRFGALPDLRIWRQNTGQAFQPMTPIARAALKRLVDSMPGQFRPVQYGTPGSADVQGILRVHVGHEMSDDETIGRFVAIEVKAENGRLSPEQEKWGAMVERQGGLYVVAKGENAEAQVAAALEGAR